MTEKNELILDIISDRFKSEIQLNSDLSNRAGSLLSMNGVIISLQGVFISFILDNNGFMQSTDSLSGVYNFFLWIFVFSVSAMLISFIFGFLAYQERKFEFNPEPTVFLETYSNKDIDKNVMLDELTEAVTESIEYNKNISNKKSNYIIIGSRFLQINIILIIIFLITLLLLAANVIK